MINIVLWICRCRQLNNSQLEKPTKIRRRPSTGRESQRGSSNDSKFSLEIRFYPQITGLPYRSQNDCHTFRGQLSDFQSLVFEPYCNPCLCSPLTSRGESLRQHQPKAIGQPLASRSFSGPALNNRKQEGSLSRLLAAKNRTDSATIQADQLVNQLVRIAL